MSEILTLQSLKNLNTFGVESTAKEFVSIKNETDLVKLFETNKLKKESILVLGGGSNILFINNFDGLVLKIAIEGIEVKEKDEYFLVRVGSGVNWHELVTFCVDHNFAGIENLSLIPGTVGASPVQNIGAYGVELKDIFFECRAFEIATGKFRTFQRDACKFEYRESIFKSELKGRFIITEVTFKLNRPEKLNTSYGAIHTELERKGIENPTIKDISEVVSAIRVSKLPDPSTIGNAGSFFKNPIIEPEQHKLLKIKFPEMVSYEVDGKYKLAAGWLIEQCGWKGKRIGNVGTWKNQALVIVNHGGASGKEIFDFSTAIIKSVNAKFGIHLEREVNIIS